MATRINVERVNGRVYTTEEINTANSFEFRSAKNQNPIFWHWRREISE
jgi:hypothetical protein